MKTFIIILTLTFQSFSSTATSHDIQPAHDAFRKIFSTATEVNWLECSPFLRVNFVLNNQNLEALYKPSGEFVSLERNISTNQLPLLLGFAAKKMLKDSWISNVQEIVMEKTHQYILTVENSDEKFIYSSRNDRKWILKTTILKF